MKRKVYLISLISLCLVFILLVPSMAGCGESVKKIGISQLVSHPALDATGQGVIDALADNGYPEGEDFVIDYQNSELDSSLMASIAQQFVADEVDVIITIATPNTQAAINAVENTDIPVVFTAITDPVGSGMVVDWDSHPD